jgi:hypothetical protein
MAWRKRREPVRIEPPEWYRVFDPAMWDEMDAQEQAMFRGCPSWRPWPDELHRIHAERRWAQAQHAYRQDHPDLAEQEFRDLIEGELGARMEDFRHD